jgi:hypothetical protein
MTSAGGVLDDQLVTIGSWREVRDGGAGSIAAPAVVAWGGKRYGKRYPQTLPRIRTRDVAL